jgi:protein-tyrosine-phosphatase
VRAGRPVNVLFVCQGNICRSAYAASALRIRMPDQRLVRIASAGMMPRPGRPTPDLAVQAAARNGIDLRAHRSNWVTRETANAASLIVIFDEMNAAALADRYPELTVPTIKLGELIMVGDIYDPIDGDAAVFDMTFAAITRGIQALARLLA